MAPAFHMVCGSPGAGKTTYSMGLAQRLKGVRFSIDEWMVGLFGKERPEPLQFPWVAERVERCERLIGRLATQCARSGATPVLDLAFLRAANRADFAAIAGQAGFAVALHVLDLPADERWSRVEARNAAMSQTCALTVSRAIFDVMEKIWQPPTAAEMSAYNGEYVSG